MINKKLFLFIHFKNLKFTPTKLNKYLILLQKKSYFKFLKIINNSLLKTNYILNQLLRNRIETSSIYTADKNLILLKLFCNKDVILKRIQARAKGQGFAIHKAYSQLNVYLCQSYLYKIYKIFNLII